MPTKNADSGYEKLRGDITQKNIGRLYVFYGEEFYLKNYYADKIKEMLVEKDFEEFNFTAVDGKNFSAQTLAEAVECMPVMSERKMIVVRDFDIMKQTQSGIDDFLPIISDLPEYVCLIFVYSEIPYKQDKKNKLCAYILDNGTVVQFKKNEGAVLNQWIKRRFASYGKDIDKAECEYLAFYSGNLMATLISEIDKVALFSKNDKITKDDIEAAAVKSLDTAIYELTDEIAKGAYDNALRKLRELLSMQYEPIVLSSSVVKQIIKLYSAKLVLSERQSRDYFMRLWDMKSTYPAEKLLRAAANMKLEALRKAVVICGDGDVAMKSQTGDRVIMLETMLLKIAAVLKG